MVKVSPISGGGGNGADRIGTSLSPLRARILIYGRSRGFHLDQQSLFRGPIQIALTRAAAAPDGEAALQLLQQGEQEAFAAVATEPWERLSADLAETRRKALALFQRVTGEVIPYQDRNEYQDLLLNMGRISALLGDAVGVETALLPIVHHGRIGQLAPRERDWEALVELAILEGFRRNWEQSAKYFEEADPILEAGYLDRIAKAFPEASAHAELLVREVVFLRARFRVEQRIEEAFVSRHPLSETAVADLVKALQDMMSEAYALRDPLTSEQYDGIFLGLFHDLLTESVPLAIPVGVVSPSGVLERKAEAVSRCLFQWLAPLLPDDPTDVNQLQPERVIARLVEVDTILGRKQVEAVFERSGTRRWIVNPEVRASILGIQLLEAWPQGSAAWKEAISNPLWKVVERELEKALALDIAAGIEIILDEEGLKGKARAEELLKAVGNKKDQVGGKPAEEILTRYLKDRLKALREGEKSGREDAQRAQQEAGRLKLLAGVSSGEVPLGSKYAEVARAVRIPEEVPDLKGLFADKAKGSRLGVVLLANALLGHDHIGVQQTVLRHTEAVLAAASLRTLLVQDVEDALAYFSAQVHGEYRNWLRNATAAELLSRILSADPAIRKAASFLDFFSAASDRSQAIKAHYTEVLREAVDVAATPAPLRVLFAWFCAEEAATSAILNAAARALFFYEEALRSDGGEAFLLARFGKVALSIQQRDFAAAGHELVAIHRMDENHPEGVQARLALLSARLKAQEGVPQEEMSEGESTLSRLRNIVLNARSFLRKLPEKSFARLVFQVDVAEGFLQIGSLLREGRDSERRLAWLEFYWGKRQMETALRQVPKKLELVRRRPRYADIFLHLVRGEAEVFACQGDVKRAATVYFQALTYIDTIVGPHLLASEMDDRLVDFVNAFQRRYYFFAALAVLAQAFHGVSSEVNTALEIGDKVLRGFEKMCERLQQVLGAKGVALIRPYTAVLLAAKSAVLLGRGEVSSAEGLLREAESRYRQQEGIDSLVEGELAWGRGELLLSKLKGARQEAGTQFTLTSMLASVIQAFRDAESAFNKVDPLSWRVLAAHLRVIETWLLFPTESTYLADALREGRALLEVWSNSPLVHDAVLSALMASDLREVGDEVCSHLDWMTERLGEGRLTNNGFAYLLALGTREDFYERVISFIERIETACVEAEGAHAQEITAALEKQLGDEQQERASQVKTRFDLDQVVAALSKEGAQALLQHLRPQVLAISPHLVVALQARVGS